ncbi:DUF6252 family protein [Weeksellaceae bacterium KMM 9724]|uniref:DUF6252 family protein n=1 Tax=Profundicola chukchiensis TaxID=2961959 RepID=UPI00243DCD8F|nr:DUF6252 family protein [Profundicola chukchiensis]MDG4949836.1 DUF6252 family protein [Profundicola chukchiensis]
MKKFKNLNLILLSFLLAFSMSACSSDDDAGGDGWSSGSSYYMRAKIDGTDWVASEESVDYDDVYAVLEGEYLLIAGETEDKSITIAIGNYSGPGTYYVGQNEDDFGAMAYYEINTDHFWSNNFSTQELGDLEKGKLVVTSDNGDVIQGSFNFNAYNPNGSPSVINITNGEFRSFFVSNWGE